MLDNHTIEEKIKQENDLKALITDMESKIKRLEEELEEDSRILNVWRERTYRAEEKAREYEALIKAQLGSKNERT